MYANLKDLYEKPMKTKRNPTDLYGNPMNVFRKDVPRHPNALRKKHIKQ